MSRENSCVDDEDVRVILKEDLNTSYRFRATTMRGADADIGWSVNSPPFVLKELKVKERL